MWSGFTIALQSSCCRSVPGPLFWDRAAFTKGQFSCFYSYTLEAYKLFPNLSNWVLLGAGCLLGQLMIFPGVTGKPGGVVSLIFVELDRYLSA